MAIRMVQDYGRWKKGDVITPTGGLAERLVGQGKAVPVKAPPSARVPEQQEEKEAPAASKAEDMPARGRGNKRKEPDPASAQEADAL